MTIPLTMTLDPAQSGGVGRTGSGTEAFVLDTMAETVRDALVVGGP